MSVALFHSVAAADEEQLLAESVKLVAPERARWRFSLPALGKDRQVRLSLEGRIVRERLAGSTHVLQINVNGQYLYRKDLINKGPDAVTATGAFLPWSKASLWRLLYSPDFRAAASDGDSPYHITSGDPYLFVFDITPYVHEGENEVWAKHFQATQKPLTIELRDVKVIVGKPVPRWQPPPPAPAPTGPVPEFVLRPPKPAAFELRVYNKGAVEIGIGGKVFRIASSFSLPNGQWLELAPDGKSKEPGAKKPVRIALRTAHYTVDRVVEKLPGRCIVSDTIRNLSPDRRLGLIVKHEVSMPDTPVEVRLCGWPMKRSSAKKRSPANPTTFVRFKNASLGMAAEDDVFRVHGCNYFDAEKFGMSDSEFALAPGASYTMRWSIYPGQGDYWDFINTVRRAWDVNFTIPGPFCFMGRLDFDRNTPLEEVRRWVKSRDLKILVSGIAKYPNGKYAHGTGILHAPKWVARQKELFELLHAACPDVKLLVYFHAQISTEPGAEKKYPDCPLLDGTGGHVNYPYRYALPAFVPTLQSSYGKAVWGYIDIILDEIGADGIYWDELSYSATPYHYGEPWDGHTAVIHPETHEIKGYRSMVPLLTQPFKLDVVKKLEARGKMIVGNTAPVTATMTAQHFPRFCETGSYTHIYSVHLFSPIGLGNHTTEMDQDTAMEHLRRILDYGAVYYGHLFSWDPPEENFIKYLFPITPIELHEGVVIGKERILTNRFGLFGWGDGTVPDVHVFDSRTKRVKAPLVKTIRRGREVLTEIRLRGDQVAAIVRRKP